MCADNAVRRFQRTTSQADQCSNPVSRKKQPSFATQSSESDRQASKSARSLCAKTEAFERSRQERKKVEMRFAHMKRIFRLDRLRLRGLSGVKDEVLLTATAQNLRRLVKFLYRPPPAATVTCSV